MEKTELSESHRNIVRNYIRAKDDNKPYIMKAAFSDSATLDMKVETDSIAFPTNTVGLDAIINVLVRNFSQTYENVYTFCFSDSLKSKKNAMSCNWLVGMTEKEGGNTRVGCGKYVWHFNDEEPQLAIHLGITIEQMLVLTPGHSNQIMEWLGKLPYPFCDSKRAFEFMPDFEPLKLVRKFV
jgi:hypothetical protein